ncbi:MAG: sugar transferase [Rhizomicrobium sp.]
MSLEMNVAGLNYTPGVAVGAYTKSSILVKRVFDTIFVIAGLPFALLVMIPIALLVAMDGHNPFYMQRRVGQHGKMFGCIKFRSMEVDADRKLDGYLAKDPALRAEWDETRKLKNDPRITRIGRFLRKTSLDELPQIFNVLLGQMSLVGPRPVVAEELPLYGSAAAVYLACLPGITGLWQVGGRCDVSYDARVALDVNYAERWSLRQDLKILLLTIPVALGRRGAY